MATGEKAPTGDLNGRLWGARAEDWAAHQEGTLAPVFDAVLARMAVGGGTRHLDLGCGSGMAAQKAAARGADVTGLDAAPALLAIARRRLPGADFRLGDLEDLPFDSGSFDTVTAFNSVQYAGNPAKALQEAARVLRPEGRIAIVTWGEPETMEAARIVAALKPLLPPPPPGAPGPFALSDEARLRAFAASGGLQPVDLFDADSPWSYPDEATALRGLASSGVAARAIAQAGAEAVDQAHSEAIAPFRQPDGSYRIGAVFRVLLARPQQG